MIVLTTSSTSSCKDIRNQQAFRSTELTYLVVATPGAAVKIPSERLGLYTDGNDNSETRLFSSLHCNKVLYRFKYLILIQYLSQPVRRYDKSIVLSYEIKLASVLSFTVMNVVRDIFIITPRVTTS